MAGDVDVGFESDSGTKYTTGGQIGAPNETGCCSEPPTSNGRNSDCPWGEWEHNHHSGPDDSFIASGGTMGIAGGSFAFHSGTASAPNEAFISQVLCADEGWCVQARPAPDKQIYWEGTGVFHNLKGKKNVDLPAPDFGGCAVVFSDKKTGGTLHYYKAHVADFGEPAGQRQKPVTAACEGGTLCLGDWDVPACGVLDQNCIIPREVNVDKTALHPLCLAEDCIDCPAWYDIEIHCTTDPASPVIYRVGHWILEGNFQLHPPVGDSCNFSCGDGVCEVGLLGFQETCESCPEDCCPN